MQHFSCDSCGRAIPSHMRRYVVRMEIYAGEPNTPLVEADLEDYDPLQALDEDLQDAFTDAPNTTCQEIRYDLCPTCHEKFRLDPLGRESSRKFDFSEN